MSSAIRILAMVGLLHVLVSGCEEETGPPPDLPKKKEKKPVVDVKHSAVIQADRRFSIPNMAIVFQVDSIGSGEMGVSLTTLRPAPDGSRLIFGTFQKAETIKELEQRPILFSGSRMFLPNQNGIFTQFAAYGPKSATLTITSLEDEEASGTLEGEFYRWPLPSAIAARPTVVDLTVRFSAVVIVR
ncbi:MAG: hypothetical protein O7D94_09165 [Planctomycetota bacterium]|nr:hypothetical protein [Planctomycetota bacterium]